MRRALAVLCCTLVGATAGPPGLARQAGTPVEPVYAAYLAGRYGEVVAAFPAIDDFRRSRGELFQAAREWRKEWRPSRAAFLVEVGLLGFTRGWTDAPQLLAAARDMAISRPRSGTNDPSAAFDIAMHRSVAAVLVARQRPDVALAYLEPLTIARSGQTVPPRLALARGLVLESQSAPFFTDGTARSADGLGTMRIGPGETARRRLAEQALAIYERLAADPDVGPEATLRRAFTLHRLRRDGEALSVVARLPATAERVVGYWGALLTGRIHDAAGRVEAAADAYETASRLEPGAQTPLVALASLHQRQGNVEAASAAAARAQAAGPPVDDPWRAYWLGDVRMLDALTRQLRSARP